MGGSPWNLRIGNPLFIGANLNIFFFPKWSHMVWTVDQRGAGAGPRDGTLKRKGCGCKLCFPPQGVCNLGETLAGSYVQYYTINASSWGDLGGYLAAFERYCRGASQREACPA